MSNKTLEKKLEQLLSEYKVIGDTTFGLGYRDTQELIDKMLALCKEERIEELERLKAEYLKVSPPRS